MDAKTAQAMIDSCEFDYRDFAKVMQEIFITLMNRIPTKEEDPDKGLSRDKAFFKANRQLVPVRKRVELAYKSGINQGSQVEVWAYGMVAHHMIVDQVGKPGDVIKYSIKKFKADAAVIFDVVGPYNPSDLEKLRQIINKMPGNNQ